MKKFIFFARVYIWCTLAIPSTLYAQELTDVYPNYVVIGAFAIQNNAVEFTKEANKNKFSAKFEMNFNRNLYYVYVRTTDDRKFAFAEALRLRKETKYFDTWVYSGPFAKVPLAEQSTKEYRDFDPHTGEGIASLNASGAEKNTSETIPPLTNGDETVTTHPVVGATLNETSEGRKNRRQEKSSRRNRKDNGAVDTETNAVNGQNVELRSPANGKKNANSIAYNDRSNGVATGQQAERNPSETDSQRTGAQANQASGQIASRTDGDQAEISSLATSANEKQDSGKTAKNNKKGTDRNKPKSSLTTEGTLASAPAEGLTPNKDDQSTGDGQHENPADLPSGAPIETTNDEPRIEGGNTALSSPAQSTKQGSHTVRPEEVKEKSSSLTAAQKPTQTSGSLSQSALVDGQKAISGKTSGETTNQQTSDLASPKEGVVSKAIQNQGTATEKTNELTPAKEGTETKGVANNTTGAKPKQSSTQVAKQGGVNGQNASLTSAGKQTESSGTSSKTSPDNGQQGPQLSGEAMKQATATGARTGKVSAQSPKDNLTASGQNGVQAADQSVELKSKSGQMAKQTLASKQNTGSPQASQQSRAQINPASDAQTSTVTSGVKDLSPEELLKISSLTDAGKKALAENRERVVKLGPPPQRTTTAQLSKEEVSGKNFYFYLFRADNLATVDGEVDAIDFEKSRRMATYQGNTPVKVIMPSGKTKQISFVCEVFGYRKQQKEFDPASPPADLYLDDKGNLVVPFELRRMEKGDIAIMYNVFFFKDAAVMRPESRYEVNNLLDLLVENPTYKVMIHGHTNGNATGKIIRMDTPGNFYTLTGTKQSFGSAKQLSEERAIVIREFLVNSGISPERMQIKAWGGKKPIHDKHSVRANENVRVEIEILSE